MHFVYILQSKKDQSFYIGHTSNLTERLEYHNSKELNIGRTKRKIPWEYFLYLEVPNKTAAIKIERHIKRMKSIQYLVNLKKYPEMRESLINRFL
ncbi:GIY-YIG nuclease family protein [Robiginitalea sp. IMCC44478]|uniref:GIY-YIG nuclease family protein n=1 Tax=Robiginitalea sp. IMCC44478 TaxID=3459122 RepID=UPI00404357F2